MSDIFTYESVTGDSICYNGCECLLVPHFMDSDSECGSSFKVLNNAPSYSSMALASTFFILFHSTWIGTLKVGCPVVVGVGFCVCQWCAEVVIYPGSDIISWY